jgi:RecA/RadA recombinase
VDPDHHAVRALRDHACGEASLQDQVEAVGGVAAMEDDLAAVEPASPRDSDQPPELGLG